MARRSRLHGPALVGRLLLVSFGAQTLQTEIETGYFLSAFPLLQNSFEQYRLVLRGLITSGMPAATVASIVGGFSANQPHN